MLVRYILVDKDDNLLSRPTCFQAHLTMFFVASVVLRIFVFLVCRFPDRQEIKAQRYVLHYLLLQLQLQYEFV